MSQQKLMTANDARHLLAMLFEDLKVVESGIAVEQDAAAIFGTYIDDADNPASLIAVDYGFAAYLGAAMTLVPVATAATAASTGDIPESILGNVREVMNILSRLFMEGSSPHLRFAEMHANRAGLNAVQQGILAAPAARLDMRLEVPGYGAGLCSLITL